MQNIEIYKYINILIYKYLFMIALIKPYESWMFQIYNQAAFISIFSNIRFRPLNSLRGRSARAFSFVPPLPCFGQTIHVLLEDGKESVFRATITAAGIPYRIVTHFYMLSSTKDGKLDMVTEGICAWLNR